METLVPAASSRDNNNNSYNNSLRHAWLRVYQHLYRRLLDDGAAEVAYKVWMCLDRLDPNAAVAALQPVQEQPLSVLRRRTKK